MFYKFPQNKRYMINKDLVVKLDGKILKLDSDKITLKIYDEEKEVDLLWMYGMSLWQIIPASRCKYCIFHLEFKPINLISHKVNEDLIPVFTKPILIKNKYRVVPTIPIYAISETGEVLNLIDNTIVHPNIRTGYLVVSNPKGSKVYTIHRMTALAWIENDDFIAKPLVNHIDGNKFNCNKNNLEWGSFSDNARHMVETGLSSQAESYDVLDIVTNEERTFHSVTTLSKYLGLNTIPHLSSRIAKHAQYVIMKRYIIKSTENDSPWLKDIDVNNYHTSRNAMNAGVIEAKKIKTGKVISGTVSEISNHLCINRSTLDGLRRKYKQHDNYGYIFRDPSYMEWEDITIIKHKYKPKKIKATHVETKEEVVFDSLREAARFIACDKKNISRRLNNGKEYKSYTFKLID